jgi:hypothetical protein
MIRLGFEVEGLEGMQAILEELRELGATATGAELRSVPRDEGGKRGQNATIINVLTENGRDFFTPTSWLVSDMGDAFRELVQYRLEKRAAQAATQMKLLARASTRMAKAEERLAKAESAWGKRETVAKAVRLASAQANWEKALAKLNSREAKSLAKLARLSETEAKSMKATAAAALRAAMTLWCAFAVNNIETGTTASGGSPRELTDAYAAQKKKKHGFIKPIGKATGKLLDNLMGKIRITTN